MSAPARSAYEEGPLAPLTLRIGVTGHRPHKLPGSDWTTLSNAIGTVLNDLAAETNELCRDPNAGLLYRVENTPPCLRIASALAEGTDRIAVDTDTLQLNFEFELIAVLPFAQDEYEKDFEPGQSLVDAASGSVGEFRKILSTASQEVQLDGNRADAETAYLRAGHYIVRHSDVLIAVWDEDEQQGGRGGTADVITLALELGLLVICICPRSPHAVTLRHQLQQSPRDPRRAADPYSADAVAAFLDQHLLFSTTLRERDVDDDEDIKRRGATRQRLTDFVRDVESSFQLDETVTPDFQESGPAVFARSLPPVWGQVFRIISNCVAPMGSVNRQIKKWRIPVPDARDPADLHPLADSASQHPSLNRIFAAYLRADQLAIHYAMLHRSIFMSIYILGGLALSAAAAALYFYKTKVGGLELKYVFAVLEFAFLGGIYVLWWNDHKRRYHDRWIEYRSLAEFLRPMIHLSLVGHTYPLNKLRDQEEEIARDRLRHAGPARSWVFMYVETVIRWAGVVGTKMDEGYLRRCRDYACVAWIDWQVRYHIHNAARMHILGHRLHTFSFVMFWSTLLAVIAKLVEWVSNDIFHAGVAGLLAGVLPALGAAAFAIRNHAEFDISAQRSQTLRTRLLRHRRNLERALRDSDQIGRELQQTAEVTIRETSDWGEIFEVKESEAG